MIAADPEFSGDGAFKRLLDRVPSAFAITSGDRHTLVYANDAFRKLIHIDGTSLVPTSLASAIGMRHDASLLDTLDRVFETDEVARDCRLTLSNSEASALSCTVWPEISTNGGPKHLVIEMRPVAEGELTIRLQRELAERMLLSALKEQDAAETAEALRKVAAILALESRRLAEASDEVETLAVMARMSLPHLGAWCIVDTLDESGTMDRVAIIHPDRETQALLDKLKGLWVPTAGDDYGLPAAMRNPVPTVPVGDPLEALARAAQSPEILSTLHALRIGPLLTVPLAIGSRLIGAVTFVAAQGRRQFTPEDIAFAEDLASRGAVALDRARLFSEAVVLKGRAETATEAKSAFLSMMSHELRTPLNAIGGYVDLMDLEIHGPVTPEQRVDLARIRNSQRYLTGLITDLLNFTRVGGGQIEYHVTSLVASEIIAAGVALVEPLMLQRGLRCDIMACEAPIIAHGDREKVIQILVNLFSNAIKFTPSGGVITIECDADPDTVAICVSDTGIGIPSEKFDAIFEPFIQVKTGVTGPEAGIGLGLAISRKLARAMFGDLTVESTLDEGSRFTLMLPRSVAEESY